MSRSPIIWTFAALGLMLVSAAPAGAVATAHNNAGTIVEVQGDDSTETITISQLQQTPFYIVVTHSTEILAGTGCSQDSPTQVSCTTADVVAVELLDGNDAVTIDTSVLAKVTTRLRGGPGNDVLTGGATRDIFLQTLGYAGTEADSDRLDGRGGVNLVDYQDSTPRREGLTIQLPDPGETTFGNGEAGESDSFKNIQQVIAGQGNDTIFGSIGENTILGAGGADHIDTVDGDNEDFVDCGYNFGDDSTEDSARVDEDDTTKGCESVEVGVGRREIVSELEAAAKQAAKTLVLDKLIQSKAFPVTLDAPTGGTVTGKMFLPITVKTALPITVRTAARRQVLAARGRKVRDDSGRTKMRMRLTKKGRRLLKKVNEQDPDGVRAQLRLSFEPTGGDRVNFKRKLTIRD